MRDLETILGDVEPAIADELHAAIGLAIRTARNAGFSSAWADARRKFEAKEAEHADVLAEALAEVRRERGDDELAVVTAERDRLRAELDQLTGADFVEKARIMLTSVARETRKRSAR